MAAMKRLFSWTQKKPTTPAEEPPPPEVAPASVPAQVGLAPALAPKFIQPAFPQPAPHHHLAIIAHADGLLLRSHVPGLDGLDSYVKIEWGKNGEITSAKDTDGGLDWSQAPTIYGIVGILRLFHTSHLLVITATNPIGNVFDEHRSVFGVKGVTAIPLEETGATNILNALVTAQNAIKAKELAEQQTPSTVLVPPTPTTATTADSEASSELPDSVPSRHVKFASFDNFGKSIGLLRASISSSDVSTGRASPDLPTEGLSTSPLGTTLVERLSFWKVSKPFTIPRPPTPPNQPEADKPNEEPTSPLTSEPEQIETPVEGSNTTPDEGGEPRPSEALDAAIAEAAPPPPTAELQHSQLDTKIVREVIREYTKGGMYFSYAWDMTTPMQRKHQQIAKLREDAATSAQAAAAAKETSSPTSRKKSIERPRSPAPTQTNETGEVDPFAEPQPTLPLWRRVDRKFWWNEHLCKPFMDAGLHTFVLPIMQGFIQITSFHIPSEDASIPKLPASNPSQPSLESDTKDVDAESQDADAPKAEEPTPQPASEPTSDAKAVEPEASTPKPSEPTIPLPDPERNDDVNDIDPGPAAPLTEPTTAPDPPKPDTLVDYVVISRRSRERAGLRYQRRGVDSDAHVANFVETETIVRVNRDSVTNVFSYLQIRGSIPLYWTQSGYGLKPPPLLDQDRTPEQNLEALRTHFQRSIDIYGPNTAVNLAEHHGKEGPITDAFREKMKELDSADAKYHEFDFHEECKGMRYENISKLVEQLQRTFEAQGFFWISEKTIMSKQKGVFRVNCIDCLDRTNVVQSAFAREVLNSELEAVALLNPSLAGRTESEVVFNDVWANNGDAISRAYAGTSALKGDFTRTGRRDLGGLLNDGINSLARVYTSTFSDWFSQAVIDFMLGYRNLSVFSEFLNKMSSTDPREIIRLSKVRAAAIETCSARVISEGETFKHGWTLFSPLELNTRLSDKFEEKVLLLTSNAIYFVSYDYTLEKVKMFSRVPLGDIVSVQKGAYIISPLEESSRDPAQNYGFLISYRPARQVTRVASYSIRNKVIIEPPVLSPNASKAETLTFPLRRSASNVASNVLSTILNGVAGAVTGGGDLITAAFKALPVDPTTAVHPSTDGDSASITSTDPTTCQEAVEKIVEVIKVACEDIGAGHDEFIVDKDVVSLAEAQRSTTIFSKFEYNLKRLLWLGG